MSLLNRNILIILQLIPQKYARLCVKECRIDLNSRTYIKLYNSTKHNIKTYGCPNQVNLYVILLFVKLTMV